MNSLFKKNISELGNKLKKDKKAVLIILLGVVGMMLITLSEFTSSEKSIETKSGESLVGSTDVSRELENIIGEMSGVGRVKVMITYECSEEKVYAKDTSEHQDDKNKKNDTEYILVGSGNEETGLMLKQIYPKICGVAVVCDGGNDPVLRNEITSVVKALFDISSNNISIVEMQS